MIDLTPLEVRQKKDDFRRTLRGYDPELVDDFLDLAADRMEELVRENMTLRDRHEALQSELASYREKERSLSEALMTAQKLRDDAKVHAEKEGDLLVREAQLAAAVAREEAKQGVAKEEEALRQLRSRRAQLVRSFRRLLEREMSELAVIEETLELDTDPAAGTGDDPVSGEPASDESSSGELASEDEMDLSVLEEGEAAEAADDSEEEPVSQDWLKSLVEEEQGRQ